MPIKLKVEFTDGWKAQENSRFGKVLVLKFINAETNNVLFEYAPKCEDKELFSCLFSLLEDYDTFLVNLRSFSSKFGEVAI